MDPKTCKSLAINPKIHQQPLIYYHSFKYLIEKLITTQQHQEIHECIQCLQHYQPEYIIWTENTFQSLLFLLFVLSNSNLCPTCFSSCLNFFKNEIILDQIKKFLPRLIGQTKPLGAFEWKCLRNFSLYLSIPRPLQRNILILIRDTFQSNTDRFDKANLMTLDSQTLFIIEYATHILFNLSKVEDSVTPLSPDSLQSDPGSITSICQQNARSLIQFTMILNGHHLESENNHQSDFPQEDEEDSSSRFKTSQMIRLEALAIWRKTFSLTISTFVVSCLMNQARVPLCSADNSLLFPLLSRLWSSYFQLNLPLLGSH
jgi:hypothetical protein